MTCTFSAYQILKKWKSWTSSQVGSRQVSSGPLHTILDLDLCYSTSVVGQEVLGKQAGRLQVGTRQVPYYLRFKLTSVVGRQVGIIQYCPLQYQIQAYLCCGVGSLGQVGRYYVVSNYLRFRLTSVVEQEVLGKQAGRLSRQVSSGLLLSQILTYLCGGVGSLGQAGRTDIPTC